MATRKYPVGIQTFERLRKENYLYIDKTILVWEMAHTAPYIFLSRPRRFGKSLLTTTLKSYFEGRRDLFEGLKIMQLEEEKHFEGFYEYTFWLIFNMLNVYARTQVKCSGGRTDFVVWMPDTTYVFYLKVKSTAQEALDQINSKGYALPYPTDGRRVVKVGITCDRETMTVGEWLVG